MKILEISDYELIIAIHVTVPNWYYINVYFCLQTKFSVLQLSQMTGVLTHTSIVDCKMASILTKRLIFASFVELFTLFRLSFYVSYR